MRRLIESKNIDNPKHYDIPFTYNFKYKYKGFDMNQPERMKALLEKYNGGKFIEVGCGIAPHCLAAKLNPKSTEVWGLDWAENLISELKKYCPEVNYIVGDARNLPFKDGYFDYLVIGEILEHMESPQDFLKEMFRVIKEGGTLALSTPLDDNGGISPEEHIWSFNENDIRELLTLCGKDIETKILDETNHHYIIGYAKK